MKCPKDQQYKVNFSGFHGVCEEHYSSFPTGSKAQCDICNSKVCILFLKPFKCTGCQKNCQDSLSDCRHLVCKDCFGPGKKCFLCRKIGKCEYCLMEREVDDWRCLHVICRECGHGNELECPICKLQENGLDAKKIEKNIKVAKRIEEKSVKEENKAIDDGNCEHPAGKKIVKKSEKNADKVKEKSKANIGKQLNAVKRKSKKKSNTEQKVPRICLPKTENYTEYYEPKRMNSDEMTDNTFRECGNISSRNVKKPKFSSRNDKTIFDVDQTSIEISEPEVNKTCLSHFLKICFCLPKNP